MTSITSGVICCLLVVYSLFTAQVPALGMFDDEKGMLHPVLFESSFRSSFSIVAIPVVPHFVPLIFR
ncbi:hypothetical protein F4813DRAFT_375755 [Daldinia decipiens]|uniref:uncharacterized protein n=1 Tax=Daldinia decipiens TaxID=326647 RepID=UPI0020C3F1DA|nr:uncharacterized protein F4813DRAFT_375755 [Daldinia decipiens]KAI1653190.1 hypothetical protein F4813DRAFT_375755 [Daldinia decipiens]